MKPMNFPARKEARKIAAEMRKDGLYESARLILRENGLADINHRAVAFPVARTAIEAARSIRTKKHR